MGSPCQGGSVLEAVNKQFAGSSSRTNAQYLAIVNVSGFPGCFARIFSPIRSEILPVLSAFPENFKIHDILL